MLKGILLFLLRCMFYIDFINRPNLNIFFKGFLTLYLYRIVILDKKEMIMILIKLAWRGYRPLCFLFQEST